METIDCIFCGPNGSVDPVVIRDNGFEGHKCGNCQLIYISPRPSPDEIANLYAHDEAKSDSQALRGNEYYRRLAAKKSLRMLRTRKSGGTLLEIGAGVGFFCDEARSAGYIPYAIEINSTQAKHCSSLGIATDSRPLAQAFPGMKFDVIYHCDVSSHFTNPLAEFRMMVDRLNPNGVLMFETGNYADIDPAYYPLIPSFQYPDHLFFFGQSSLQLLMERSRLKTLKIARFGRWVEMMIQKKSPKNKAVTRGKDSESTVISRKGEMKQLLRYALVYKLGALHALRQAPQTMIVIATPV